MSLRALAALAFAVVFAGCGVALRGAPSDAGCTDDPRCPADGGALAFCPSGDTTHAATCISSNGCLAYTEDLCPATNMSCKAGGNACTCDDACVHDVCDADPAKIDT